MNKYVLPLGEEEVLSLKTGDQLYLSGVIVTGRDRAHKYMADLIDKGIPAKEEETYSFLLTNLNGAAIYHCGPVVKKESETWKILAFGPTTSMREESYQAKVIEHFRLRAVIGKGGMGTSTLDALVRNKCLYLQAVGGAAVVAAHCCQEVIAVKKLEFGFPEAFWIVRIENFPVMVTMDAHGRSLHQEVEKASNKNLLGIIN